MPGDLDALVAAVECLRDIGNELSLSRLDALQQIAAS